jgi:hypothetical protein
MVALLILVGQSEGEQLSEPIRLRSGFILSETKDEVLPRWGKTNVPARKQAEVSR